MSVLGVTSSLVLVTETLLFAREKVQHLILSQEVGKACMDKV